MRPRTIALLLFVFLGLYAWIQFGETRKGAGKKEPKPGDFLFDVTPERVSEFTVSFAGKDVRLVRNGTDWTIASPVRYPADNLTVGSLLARLHEMVPDRMLDPVIENREAFGLETPIVVLTVHVTGDSVPHVLRIGGPTPTRDAYYVESPGLHRVGTVAMSTIDSYLKKDLRDLRDHVFLPLPPDSARALVLVGGKGAIEARRDQGVWKMVRPFPGLADAAAIDEYLGNLKSARVEDFVPEPVGPRATYGLDRPQVSGTVTYSDTLSRRFAVGKARAEGDLVHAESSERPGILLLRKQYVEVLVKTDLDFREKKPVSFDPFRADSLVIESAGRRGVAVSDTMGHWGIPGRAIPGADSIAIRSCVQELSTLAADRIEEASKANVAREGLLRPRFTVAVHRRGKDWLEIAVGRADGETTWILPKTRAEILHVPGDALARIPRILLPAAPR